MPLISVCIPAYEMHGRGAAFLARTLRSLDRQTLLDFEAIVSDHSADDVLEALCAARRQSFPLRYVRCPVKRGNSSANMNFAVSHARGDIVKILHQDDFLVRDDALTRIARSVREAPDRHWGGTGCIHVNEAESEFYRPHIPFLHPLMLEGHNGFGAPSLMFVRRASYLEFDEELIWVNDCEVYHRLHQAFGEPIIIPELLVAIRRWGKQVSNAGLSDERKSREIAYATRKHRTS
jgi:glycosyltransferase involved in cell wall biosynthesis